MSAVLSTTLRLEQSRARLRHALQASAHGDQPPTSRADALVAWPVIGVALAALRAAWAGHPLHDAVAAAAGALGALVRRHPVAIVLGAAVAGGLLAWSRPWRWAGRPHRRGALLPRLLVAAIAQVPLRSWIATWSVPRQGSPAVASTAADRGAADTPEESKRLH